MRGRGRRSLGLLATLADLTRRWYVDPQYSHGFLVPAFAAFLLWTRRKELSAVQAKPTWWRCRSSPPPPFYFWPGATSIRPGLSKRCLRPALVGIVLAVWGWEALRLCSAGRCLSLVYGATARPAR